jgi:hypothetical protein
MGFPPFLSEITAIVSQKSSLEANWGVKMKPAVSTNKDARNNTKTIRYRTPRAAQNHTSFPLGFLKRKLKAFLDPS